MASHNQQGIAEISLSSNNNENIYYYNHARHQQCAGVKNQLLNTATSASLPFDAPDFLSLFSFFLL